jgi:sigma-B regulation protein RsbU (phosphoserine phosphatase)
MDGFLFACLLVAGVGAWFLWWSDRREILRLEEEKLRLQAERKIVVDFMHTLAEALAKGVDRDELYRWVVRAGIESTGALSACVFERDGQTLRGVALQGLFPPHRPLPPEARKATASRARFLELVLKSETFAVGEGLVGEVAQTGRGILIRDATQDPRVVRHEDPALQVKSVIVVPISFRERNIAVLAIVNRSDGIPFGASDLALAESLGEQAGLALKNLELMALQMERNRIENDLELASSIQGMLLPKHFPELPEYEFASIYEPAQKVGGDLFDVFELGDGRIGVAVADVSGKGVPASLVMAICQSNLRHFARANPDSPAAALRKLNEVIHAETGTRMFVTMVYGVIDPTSGTVTLARAGHERPLLGRARGSGGGASLEFVRSTGMAVGMVPDAIFSASLSDARVELAPGDCLVLFTDGITEATNPRDEEFSNQRLGEVVKRHLGESAQAINAAIRQSVARFCGELVPTDDFTVLTIKRKG